MSLDMVLYPFVASLTLDASSGNVVGGATGEVFAKADTTFTTALPTVDASGNPVTLTSNANGVLPSFYVNGHTAVNWKSGEWVLPLITSEPVEGPEGPAGVSVNGATATGDDLVFSLSNGSTTPPVKLPTGAGGSDAGVASYITTPGTETAAALSATIASEVDPLAVEVVKKVAKGELVLNVKDHGVKGDAVRRDTGATISAGSTSLTGSGFTAADVGKFVSVAGAGTSGAALNTTIAAVVNDTSATLTAAASTAVTNGAYLYGTDDTVAIQAILDGVHNGSYFHIFFPKGSYLTDGLKVKSNTQLIGAGKGAWAYEFYERTTRIIAKPGTAATGLITDYSATALGGNVRIIDMMLDGAKAFHSVAVKGIHLPDSTLSADSLWSIERVYVGFFSGVGIHLGAFRRANRLNDVHVWQCNGEALVLDGSDNNIMQSIFAQCGGDGVRVTQSTNHFYGCDIFSNEGHGVFTTPLARMTMMTNCSIDHNKKSGVLGDAKNLSLVQCRFSSNSQSADGVYPDIDLLNGRQGVSIVAPIFYAVPGETVLPHSAIRASGNNATNPVMLVGFSYDPSTTTWRSGSYVDTQVAMLHKGFNLADGSVIHAGTGSGARIGGSATQKLGFWGAIPIARPVVTGARGGNAAVADLLLKLNDIGVIDNQTTA